MPELVKPSKIERIIILFSLFLYLFACELCNAQEINVLTPAVFNSELRQVLLKNDVNRACEIIKNNRLLTKPFVNELITESIRSELKGESIEAHQLRTVCEKAAKYFEDIFGEKSLAIGVDYITKWSLAQKKMKLEADSLYDLGTKSRLNEENEKALDLIQSALQKYREIGDERGEAETLGGLGALYYNNFGDFKEAFESYRIALTKREKVDDKQLIGNTLNSLGAVYAKYFRDFPVAIDYYERAEAVRTELGQENALWAVIYNKADAYRLYGDQLNIKGNFDEALETLKNAYEIFKNIGRESETGDVISIIGFVYSKLGDYNTAAEKQMEAIKIMQAINDTIGLAGVYNNFGIVLQKAGRMERSLDYYNNALRIYEERNLISEMIPVIGNIGTLYFDLKDYNKAEEYHSRGLKLCGIVNDKEKETDFLLNLANDKIFLGKHEEALTYYEEGLKAAQLIKNPDIIWRIKVGMAECYESRGDYKRVVELNDAALGLIDSLRNSLQDEDLRATLMARERFIFEDIIDLLTTLHENDRSKGYDELAFYYAERCKSRVLLDMLSHQNSGEINTSASDDSSTMNPETVTLNDVKSLCPDNNTVLLEYSVGDSSSCLWVITNSEHNLYKLPPKTKLQNQIETIRFALNKPSSEVSDFLVQTGIDLYNELIGPAEDLIAKRNRLIIIPDGVLNYLPFEVLLTDSNKIDKRSSYSDYPFLVKKYSVSYIQSTSVLNALLSQNNLANNSGMRDRDLLAFGDPLCEDTIVKPEDKFPRLKFSSREIEKIASLFSEESAEIYLRTKATEENFKPILELNKFSYIHFATHGLINEDKPDLSSLVLTAGKNSPEDGYLTTSEILRMNLNARLVVLSACQTGLGKLVRGEGIVGFTRAFMYAGVPSVLVSLWSVSDNSSADLMAEFYKSLIKKRLCGTDALRRAQLYLLRKPEFAHPFYWAPFVLIGDWR